MNFGRFTSYKMRWVGTAIAALFVVGFLTYITSPLAQNRIPSTFNDSRQLAASIAQDIVGMLDETARNVDTIENFEKNYRFYSARELVLGELQKSRDLSDKAGRLASHLEIMAKEIPGIAPDEAAQTALVAISSETALINQLLVYNTNLSKLFVLLQDKLANKNISIEEINAVIDDINKGRESINQLNGQFVNLMQQFDGYFEE